MFYILANPTDSYCTLAQSVNASFVTVEQVNMMYLLCEQFTN